MWLSNGLTIIAYMFVLSKMHDRGVEFKKCTRELAVLDTTSTAGSDAFPAETCPAMNKALRCVDRVFSEKFPVTLEETADFMGEYNEELAKTLRVAVNTKSMLLDFCTDGTQLNEDFKADKQCFESIDQMEVNRCRDDAIYEVFADISHDPEGNLLCQQLSFMAACVSSLVHEKCGQRAFNTIHTMLKRTTLIPNTFCSNENLEELKTTIINRLNNMPEAKKDIFRQGLDLKRRRK